jgi:hypothetical protein
VKNIKDFNSFSINEELTIKIIEELNKFSIEEEDLNESIKEWFLKIKNFFTGVNDSIRNIMLTILEKGFKSLDILKKFINMILSKIQSLNEKYPILCKIVTTTLILLVLLFVLCSAASTADKQPPEGVINAAIGLLYNIQQRGSQTLDEATLMKAQAYLLELKRGKVINVGEKSLRAAEGAIKIIQQHVKEYSETKNEEDGRYLLKLAEQGAKLVSYKIEELHYENTIGSGSTDRVSLGYK